MRVLRLLGLGGGVLQLRRGGRKGLRGLRGLQRVLYKGCSVRCRRRRRQVVPFVDRCLDKGEELVLFAWRES